MIEPQANIPKLHRFEHDAMACTFALYIVGGLGKYARQAAQAVFAEIDRLEQLFSRFVPHSEIAQLNDLTPGKSLTVSPETAECLQLAAEICRDTRGAFDVAYRTNRDNDAASGPAVLVFDPAAHAVGVQVAGVDLDLGGIGKGYALDRAVTLLKEWDISTALLHSGQSTVYALGKPPRTDGWTIHLRRPEPQAPAWATVTLADAALSGSGQYLRQRHIVDPRAGHPVGSAAAAWARASSAALADALSTAFMILTPDEISSYCADRPDVSGIVRDESAEAADDYRVIPPDNALLQPRRRPTTGGG